MTTYPNAEKEIEKRLAMNEYVTIVDVGVNIGKYSLRIANGYKHKSVGVIAIEAHPETYRALCKNIENNTEVQALNGATNTLKQLRLIIVETHGGNYEKVKQIHQRYAFNMEVIGNTKPSPDIRFSIGLIIGSK